MNLLAVADPECRQPATRFPHTDNQEERTMNRGTCPVCMGPSDPPCLACQMKPQDYLPIKDVWLAVRPAITSEAQPVAVDWAIVDLSGDTIARWDWTEHRYLPTADPIPESASQRYAWLEVTTHCPHRCRHCFLGERLGHGHAPAQAVHNALDQLLEWNVAEIVISGGEPTMHPDFVAILRHSWETASHVRVLTNGWTQRAEVVQAFAQPGISVEIPLLGLETDHDWMTRTTGSYRRIHKTLHLYREAGVDLTLTTTVTQQTVKALPALKALAEQLRIPFVATPLSPQGLAQDNWTELYGESGQGPHAL